MFIESIQITTSDDTYYGHIMWNRGKIKHIMLLLPSDNESPSTPADMFYTVKVFNKTSTCSCLGWTTHGYCKHTVRAKEILNTQVGAKRNEDGITILEPKPAKKIKIPAQPTRKRGTRIPLKAL